MIKKFTTTRYILLVLGLVLLFPLFIIVCFLIYANVFKSTPVYSSHHLHTPYPKIIHSSPDLLLMIRRGAYIAKIGNCISCHTVTNKPAFSGGLAIDTPFGTLYSTNITPDKDTGLGRWEETDFIKAMTKGVSPTGRHYFPAFPYPYFSRMKKENLHALFAYLQHIPSVRQKNKLQPFPFNLPFARASMAWWNRLFMTPLVLPSSTPTPQIKQGAYLVQGLAHCGLCHTPLNLFGAPKTDYFLSGRFVGGYWAPNISKAGLSHVTIHDIVRAFDQNNLLNDAGPLAGPMTEVTLNSLHYLSNEDKRAIAGYLKSVNSKSTLSVIPSTTPPSLTRGKFIYKKTCVLCHQKGQMGAPRLGNANAWLSRLKRHGIDTLYQRTLNGFNNMPAFGACVNCSKNDIISAVNYILYSSLPSSQWHSIKK